METNEYVYLWVLDFNDAQVYKYTIKQVLYDDYPDYPEEYCLHVQWMVSPYDEVLDENNGWAPLTK